MMALNLWKNSRGFYNKNTLKTNKYMDWGSIHLYELENFGM